MYKKLCSGSSFIGVDTNFFVLYWLPRVVAVAFTIFLGLFAFDAFEIEGSMLKKLVGFLIHLGPNYILVLLTILAWKKEKIGGVAFIVAAVLFTLLFKTYTHLTSFFVISFPIFLIGILFIYHNYMTRQKP